MLFGKLFTNPKMWMNGNADEIKMSGVYTCKDVQNVPTGDGALFVFKTEDAVKQVFVPVGEDGVVYTRVLGEEWTSVTGTSEETEALIQSAIDKANQAQAKADTVDTRLNNIIVESGTSDAEVVAARTDSDGQTFTTLGMRLDTQFGNIKDDLSILIKSEQLVLNWSDIGTSTYPLGWRKGYYSSSTGAFSTSEHYISTLSSGSETIKKLLQNTEKITVIPPEGYTLTVTAFDTPYSSTSHNIVFRTDATTSTDITVNHDYYYVFTIGRFNDNAESFITKAFINSIVARYVNKYDNVSPLSTFNIGMFTKIGICGYSWDAGYYYTTDGNAHTNRLKSWGAILARKWGINFGCYAVPSATSVKPDSEYDAISWQKNANGLPALLADSPCDFYVMHMFGNDLTRLGTEYVGTIDDIKPNYAENPDTYCGNMGRIIAQIKAHSPNALIVLTYNYYSNNAYTDYYNALVAIANHYNLPVIDWYDDMWYATELNLYLINNHPTLASYSSIANSFERLFAKCVTNNWNYFKSFNA